MCYIELNLNRQVHVMLALWTHLENCGEWNEGWLGGEMTPPMRVAGEGALVLMDPGAEYSVKNTL